MTTVEVIAIDEHRCAFRWCEGTMWRHHHNRTFTMPTTGRDTDVVDGLAVTVMTTYIEGEDPRPRILLLHFGSDSDSADVDVDVSPTAAEARRIAINLLEAADHLDQGVNR